MLFHAILRLEKLLSYRDFLIESMKSEQSERGKPCTKNDVESDLLVTNANNYCLASFTQVLFVETSSKNCRSSFRDCYWRDMSTQMVPYSYSVSCKMSSLDYEFVYDDAIAI